MSYVFVFLLGCALFALRPVYLWGVRVGVDRGTATAADRWEKLRRTPIAGQSVDIPGLGEVMILGLGTALDPTTGAFSASIDYIPTRILGGKLPSEVDAELLAANTISCPLDRFVAQAEVSLRFL